MVPQANWLRDILDRLPSLQSLIASKLSFFDHQSLQAVDQMLGESSSNPRNYPLRLLTASGCENTTATSLRLALQHFPDLVYLDLSSTQGVRNQYLLHALGSLSDLRVLKLRHCGLRDDEIEFLSFSARLLSLDLSENLITETGLFKLLKKIPEASYAPPSPFARRYSSIPLPKKVLADGIENYVFKSMTSRYDGYLDIEEGLPTQFAQLYLAQNLISVEALAKSLHRFNLDHLDCGSMYLSSHRKETLHPTSDPPGSSYNLPGKQRLSPAIFSSTFRNIRSLRIHHSLITTHPFSGTELPLPEQCFELHSEELRFELDSAEIERPAIAFELDDTSIPIEQIPLSSEILGANARFETPEDVGTSIKLSQLSNSVGGFSQSSGQPSSTTHRSTTPQHSNPSVKNETNESGAQIHELNIESQTKYPPALERSWEDLSHRPKPTTLKEVIDDTTQRRQRISARERHPGRFKPSMLPNLKVLTLTDVPTRTRNRDIPDSISMFLQECAEDEEISRLEEISHQNSGFATQNWDLHQSLPLKLRTIVLEVSSGSDPVEVLMPGTPRVKRNSFTKSSTEDADSESFMEASERDFSFFAEDDGGLLVSKGRIDAPVFLDDGLMVKSAEGNHLIDVIPQVAAFRREKKAQWNIRGDNMINRVDAALLGYWRGEVKIIKEVVG